MDESGKAKQIILVVAGNFNQFKFKIDEMMAALKNAPYKRSHTTFETDDVKYIYVSTPDHMKGFSNVKVQFWGTYNELVNFDEFEENAKILYYSL